MLGTVGNVIHVDHPTWYCMRQCSELIKWHKRKNDPKFEIEMRGEEELYRTYMSEVLNRKEAA